MRFSHSLLLRTSSESIESVHQKTGVLMCVRIAKFAINFHKSKSF